MRTKTSPKLHNLIGMRFGRLVPQSLSKKYGRTAWLCRCDCGNSKVIDAPSLVRGSIKSCGCILRGRPALHGESKGSKEYKTWSSMIERCYIPTAKSYHLYGQRGITVSDRWLNSYKDFLADVGRAPSPRHSLDRRDNSKGYCNENCRWATAVEQSNNRRSNINFTHCGVTKTLAMWARHFGVRYTVFYSSVRRHGIHETFNRIDNLQKNKHRKVNA